jgi:ceramide glucosyltransferase
LITLVAGVSQFAQYRRMRLYVAKALAGASSNYRPKLSVILPCKGLDLGFKSNILNLLAQDYSCSQSSEVGQAKSDFEVVFSVASANDPAYAVLKEIIESQPFAKAKLVVAGISNGRAQKINNQLAALEEIDPSTEVLVFVDSDVVARPDFLSYLVAPLQDKAVGVATGYRFYIPLAGDWPSLLRSLWNRLTAWELVSDRYSFAWGGAMAITREHFFRAKVREHWHGSADDDLSMTTAVKNIGLSVKFVPQCLVISNGDISLGEAVEWMNRQLILTKIYYPALWRKAMLRAAVLATWLLAMICCICQMVCLGSTQEYFALAIGLLLIPVELFFLLQAHSLWRSVVLSNAAGNNHEQWNFAQSYEKSLARYAVILPLAHLVLPWLTLYSIVTNRIRWRGVDYLLKSENEVIILSENLEADEKSLPIKEKVFF